MAQFISTGITPTFWLSLNPFCCPQRFDYVGAAVGLIRAQLKSEFTNKKIHAQNQPQHNLSTHTFYKLIRIRVQNQSKVMARSQWICNSCSSGFETRGKRDAHGRKEHPNRFANPHSEVLKIRTRYSNDGTLSCSCGRYYKYVQSLNRHKASCTKWILMQQPEFAREQSPNYIFPSLDPSGTA